VTTLGKEAADRLLALYRAMTRIRVAEKHLAELFAAGDVPGFIHLSIGQEAAAVGVNAALGMQPPCTRFPDRAVPSFAQLTPEIGVSSMNHES